MTSVLILGGSGLVGSVVRARWDGRLKLDAPTHGQLDVQDAAAVERYFGTGGADAEVVLNLAAWADVDGAEAESGNTDGTVYRLNVTYPRQLATLCGTMRKHLVHVSTDYVFDGTNAERPYTEDDTPNALCWYAETKLQGERAVLDSGADVCVARIEMPFTGRDTRKRDLARLIATRLQAGQPIQGVTDQRITPLFLDHASEALRKLVEARYLGIMHVAASDWTTPYAFAVSIARRLRLDPSLVHEETFERFSTTRRARRPQHSWLDVSRFERQFGPQTLRPVEEELDVWAVQFSSVVSPA